MRLSVLTYQAFRSPLLWDGWWRLISRVPQEINIFQWNFNTLERSIAMQEAYENSQQNGCWLGGSSSRLRNSTPRLPGIWGFWVTKKRPGISVQFCRGNGFVVLENMVPPEEQLAMEAAAIQHFEQLRHDFLGGGNSNIFGIFTPTTWRNDPIWRAYFSHGLVQPPTCFSTGKKRGEERRWLRRIHFLKRLQYKVDPTNQL